MPRGRWKNKEEKKETVFIQIHSVEFKSFKETPLKADNILRKITSLNEVEIIPFTYYIVKYFDSISNSLKYYILVPLEHSLEDKVDALKDIGYVADGFLTIQVEEDNELIQLLEKIDEKLISYDDEEVHVIIVDNDIQFDSKYGHIRVEKKIIPYTHPVNKFIINNMQIARVWFEVHDFLIVQKEGKTIATRFKIVEKKHHTEKKRIIHISYSTGKHKDALKAEVVEHMFKLLIKDINNYKKMISNHTLQILEKIVKVKVPEPYQEQTLEMIKEKFEKLEPILEVERVMSPDTFFRLEVSEGTFNTEDIVPAFIINNTIKKHYDEIFYDLLFDIKKQLKLHQELQKAEESQKEKPSKGILEKIKRVYIKDEKEEKKNEKQASLEKRANDEVIDAILETI